MANSESGRLDFLGSCLAGKLARAGVAGRGLRVSSTKQAQEGKGKWGRMGAFLWTEGIEGVLPGPASRWRRE